MCGKLAAEIERLRAELAARRAAELAARLAPYRELLSGDKIHVFESYGMQDLIVYGVKGVELSTPEKLRAADRWFLVLGGEDQHGRTTWILRRLQFKGSKLRSETERTGLGSEPPARLFR